LGLRGCSLDCRVAGADETNASHGRVPRCIPARSVPLPPTSVERPAPTEKRLGLKTKQKNKRLWSAKLSCYNLVTPSWEAVSGAILLGTGGLRRARQGAQLGMSAGGSSDLTKAAYSPLGLEQRRQPPHLLPSPLTTSQSGDVRRRGTPWPELRRSTWGPLPLRPRGLSS
jgi:hypothetical protein